MDEKEALKNLREYVDALDEQMISLMAERLKAGNRIAELTNTTQATSKKRQQELLEQAEKLGGSENKYETAAFVNTLSQISGRRRSIKLHPNTKENLLPKARKPITKDARAVFLEDAAGYTEKVVKRLYPKAQDTRMQFPEDVFKAVEEQKADYGVLPIEENYGEAVVGACEMLLKNKLYIVGETWQETKKKDKIRYIIIANTPEYTKKSAKCSAVFKTENKSGGLNNVLLPFTAQDINLTNIHSHLSSDNHYYFYVDFEGNINDENVTQALRRIESVTGYIEVLGCYDTI